MSLKLWGIKGHGIKVATNPDTFIKSHEQDAHILQEIIQQQPLQVRFSKWKSVIVDEKKNMKVVTREISKEEFVATCEKELEGFREHVRRVKPNTSS